MAASLHRSRARAPATDLQTVRLLYAILKQLGLKGVDWNLVASTLDITNGHAARMRYSRFRQHMEGRPTPQRGTRKEKAKDGGGKKGKKRGKEVDGDDDEEEDESCISVGDGDGGRELRGNARVKAEAEVEREGVKKGSVEGEGNAKKENGKEKEVPVKTEPGASAFPTNSSTASNSTPSLIIKTQPNAETDSDLDPQPATKKIKLEHDEHDQSDVDALRLLSHHPLQNHQSLTPRRPTLKSPLASSSYTNIAKPSNTTVTANAIDPALLNSSPLTAMPEAGSGSVYGHGHGQRLPAGERAREGTAVTKLNMAGILPSASSIAGTSVDSRKVKIDEDADKDVDGDGDLGMMDEEDTVIMKREG